MLASTTATPSTIAATWLGLSALAQASTVLTFDLETQKPKNMFFGHLYNVKDIAAAPAAWPGAENLFATCAASGDVKLWDVRCSGSSAAVPLVTGGYSPMEAVVLASNTATTSSSSSGGNSGSNQLGAGMLCFAGGACESVWAWDVRAGSAQTLYQLSTGNQVVNSLAWHQGSSSLIASCEALHDW